MNAVPTPPGWAETMLTLLVSPAERDDVSGDLLEAYRDSVYPRRGPVAADVWYCGQVASFAWRRVWFWVVLLAIADVGRTALDWFVPTMDFSVRSNVSTLLAVGSFVLVGFAAAWRLRSVRSAAAAGFVTAAATAAVSLLATLLLLALRHDPATLAGIEQSGGLAEALLLRVAIILPATVLATMGGFLGKTAQSLIPNP